MSIPEKSQNHYPIHIEGTFAEYPFFYFGRRRGKKTFDVFEFVTFDGKSEVARKINVSNGKYGVPGELEYLVFVWLLKKTYDQDFQETIHFTIGELVKALGYSLSGDTYNRTKEALDCLAITLLQFENSFYSKGEYISRENYRIFSAHKYWKPEHKQEGVSRRRAREKTFVTWSPEFLENLKQDYYKIIDWNFFMSLKKAVEKRLYVLLEKKMGRSGEFWIGWEKLADLVPLTSKKKTMKKKYLIGPLNTLAIKGFLIYSEDEKGVLRFTRVHRPTEEDGNKGELYAILERLGISGNLAQKKCAELSTEALERYTAWLVWYFLEKDIRKDPSGLFFKGIKDGWTPQDEFLLGWYKYVWPQIKSKILEDKHWIENYVKEQRELGTEEKEKRKDSKPELVGSLINWPTVPKREKKNRGRAK